MQQLILIKIPLKLNQQTGDIVEIFPEDHKFSEREKQIFDIILIEDYKVETLQKEIELYHAISEGLIINRRYYENGELKWN